MNPLRIGSRGSPLALWQANWVQARLRELAPDRAVEIEIIKTSGDKFLDAPLARVGGKGLFVKEIEDALLERRIDLAVHSLKDVPAELPPGLMLTAYPEREDPRDAMVVPEGASPSLEALARGARMGTTSLRRQSQLLAKRPDLEIVPLRGNVGTRLDKLARGEVDAIMLAHAGLRRLGLGERAGYVFGVDELVPAVGQGVLAIETRSDDDATRAVVERLDVPASRAAVTAERAFLLTLEAGCLVPVGGYATLEGERLRLRGIIASPDGGLLIRREASGPISEAAAIGVGVAEEILAAGGARILADLAAAG
jgi:hydroxymethylbilane synthase